MIVPLFGLLIFLRIICRTISTPLISSPCNQALNKTVGPSILERSTIIGILSLCHGMQFGNFHIDGLAFSRQNSFS